MRKASDNCSDGEVGVAQRALQSSIATGNNNIADRETQELMSMREDVFGSYIAYQVRGSIWLRLLKGGALFWQYALLSKHSRWLHVYTVHSRGEGRRRKQGGARDGR